jgi:5-methylcytosine-specific restriction enzyme A
VRYNGQSDPRYRTMRWLRLRAHQLRIEPMCRLCSEKGVLTPARVADHVERHNNDVNKFWCGELQSLCFNCHSNHKQQVELSGFSREIGADGFPIDRKHPFYAG